MKSEPVRHFDSRSIVQYCALLLFSVGWTVIFVTEYLFNTDHSYDGAKVTQGLVLIPVFFILGWILKKIGFDPVLKIIPLKHLRTLLIWSGIMGGIFLCYFPPSNPLFNAFHTLDITVPKTGTLEISEIRKMDGRTISGDDILLTGTWATDGNTFVSSPLDSCTLHFGGIIKGDLTIHFRENTTSVLPIVKWDGSTFPLITNPDSPFPSSIKLPGFVWNALSPAQKAISCGLFFLDWIGLTGGILIGWLLLKRKDYGSSMVFFVFIFMLTTYLNVQSFSHTSPRSFGDTLDYLGRGLLVIDGVEVCCQRPFVVPAAFQLLQYNTKFITDFHLLFSIVSWTILAASITTIVSHPVFKKLSFAFILFFSLSTSINQWNKALLSESITLSLTALMIACWIIYLKIPRWQTFAAVGIVTILWNFTRYTNNYLTLMITACLFLFWIFRKSWRNVLNASLIAFYLLISIWGLVDSRSSQGWIPSYGDVLIQRIFPDLEAREYFAQAGMPVYPAVNVLEKNHLASTNDWAFFRRDDLQGLRTWIKDRGMSTYVAYMVSHPQKVIETLWNGRDDYLSGWDPENSYMPKGYQPPLGKWLNLSDTPYSSRNLIFFTILMAAFTTYCFFWKKIRGEYLWIPLFLVLSAIPVFFITYLSDSGDHLRHALTSGMQIRLGLWMILLFLIDGFLVQSISEK